MTELDPEPYMGWSGQRYSESSWASLYDGPIEFCPRPEYLQYIRFYLKRDT